MAVLTEDALTVAVRRYFLNKEEGWENCCKRSAKFAASAEVPEKRSYWEEKYMEMMYDSKFLPGGRILRNAGKLKGSVFNCFVLPVEDDIVSIGDLLKNALIIWSEGGGVGVNFSALRPGGAPLKTRGGESSGLVSFISVLDHAASIIKVGGQRRAACIAIVKSSHPEIEAFIDAKLKDDILSCFNISVSVDEDFLTAVEKGNGAKWDLKFGGKIYDSVDAKKLWQKIINNMINHGEPGLINERNLAKNNSYYYNPIISSNPCGEAPLGPNEACDLGSLVLPNFVKQKNTDLAGLAETIETAVRFLDNIIDVNYYSLFDIENQVKQGRRIGLGTMGLADYLFKKELRYGSPKAIAEVERLYKFIRDKAYEVSIKLAIEKGVFPKFDKIAYGQASFIRKLPASLRKSIKDHGTRNVTLLTQAPTGTTSLVAGVTSGIEPLFCKAYKRKDNLGERVYIHSILKELGDNEIPEWFVDSYDLTPVDHFETQAAITRFTDGAVAKTINLSKETTVETLNDLLLEYIWDLKGVTVYRDGSRKGQVLIPLEKDKIKRYINKGSNSLMEEDVECASGTCDI